MRARGVSCARNCVAIHCTVRTILRSPFDWRVSPTIQSIPRARARAPPPTCRARPPNPLTYYPRFPNNRGAASGLSSDRYTKIISQSHSRVRSMRPPRPTRRFLRCPGHRRRSRELTQEYSRRLRLVPRLLAESALARCICVRRSRAPLSWTVCGPIPFAGPPDHPPPRRSDARRAHTLEEMSKTSATGAEDRVQSRPTFRDNSRWLLGHRSRRGGATGSSAIFWNFHDGGVMRGTRLASSSRGRP